MPIMGPTLPCSLLLLLLSLTSSLSSAVVCSPRPSSPYDTVIKTFLPPPKPSNATTPPPSSPVTAPDETLSSPAPETAPADAAPKPTPNTSMTTTTTTDTITSLAGSVAASVVSVVGSGISGAKSKVASAGALDPAQEGSLTAVCGGTSHPELCESMVRSGPSSSGKPLDAHSVLRIVLEPFVDATRDLRDKARAASTTDLREDPVNTCNRSLGYCLVNAKEAIVNLDAGADPGTTVRSGLDACSNSVYHCTSKPTAIQADVTRFAEMLDVCKSLVDTLDPVTSSSFLFAGQIAA